MQAADGGVSLCFLCGFVEVGAAEPKAAATSAPQLELPASTAVADVALLRAFGEMIARARPTPSELSRGPPPSLRPPLMRHPPSFRGLRSCGTLMQTEAEALCDRAQLHAENEVREWRDPALPPTDVWMHPELALL